MFCSPFFFTLEFRLIPSTSPRRSPSSSLRSTSHTSHVFSKFSPLRIPLVLLHRRACLSPARHLTLNFSFYPFSVPPIRKSSCSHWLGPTYKSPPLGLAERQPTTALFSSLSLLSCAPDTRPPDRPTSSSINDARNLSRLPANPYVHPFLLPSDTSRSYRDSRLDLPSSGDDYRLVTAPQTRSSSRSRTLGTQLWFIFPLPLFELTRRLTIYVTIQSAKTGRKDKSVPYRGR